ncbi:sensor histidine kinase [Clostridium gelidum]|nr:sensor histidine kinase [Clostridium gelidum]
MLYNLLKNEQIIESEAIKGDTLEESFIKEVINRNKNFMNNKSKKYEEALKEMEEYISRWVHEIKLPISALNIILDRIDDIELNNSIKNQVEKINSLVSSVLYGSRLTSLHEDIFIKEEKLKDIIEKSIRNNAFFLIKNKIDVKLDNLNQNIYTDSKWMIYVADQIISNAIKYCSDVKKIEFSSYDEENCVVLNIKDYGIGIKKEDIKRIFDKGFTGINGRNKIYKSTGMGLYFSKRALDKLGHKIEANSKENEFTEFKVYFYKISDYLNVTKM